MVGRPRFRQSDGMATTSPVYYGPSDRCTDADRELIAQRIRDGHVDGRLDAEEFAGRLDVALSAKTYGDLERSTRDLRR
jgi:hypothetical protein